jgi:dienelactone hydrolase
MAEIVLFHHVQGLTDGVLSFAERLREGGNVVHTPDLFDGRKPASIEDGLALTGEIGDAELDARVDRAVADLPAGLVYAGFSYGGASAQRLAQTRPGARGALLYESFVPLEAEWSFGPWPDGLPAQVHGMDRDPFFALEGDLAGAQRLAASDGAGLVEVFTYGGDRHLFTDETLPSYDAAATQQVIARSLEFAARVA